MDCFCGILFTEGGMPFGFGRNGSGAHPREEYDQKSALIKLRDYYDACERVIARHEARDQWDDFRLKHRLLE